MLKSIKQDFIYGFKIRPQEKMDVMQFCSEYQLDYACSGEYSGDAEAVIGIKLKMVDVIGDEEAGRGKVHFFSVDPFITACREAREQLPNDVVQLIRNGGKWLAQEGKEPVLWTISYQE